MAALSLVCLCVSISAAFFMKLNTGLISLAMALLLGRFAGITDKWLIASFNNSLFIMLLGVMYLFCIAQNNKTLELLAKKTINLCGEKINLIPWILFIMAAVFSAIGPGPISVGALLAVLIMALAQETKIEPIRLIPFGSLGAFAGGLTPITPSGIVAISVSEKNGITGVAFALPIKMLLMMLLYSLVLYFFVFKWHKVKPVKAEGVVKAEIPKFSSKQWATLSGIVIVAVLSTVFNVNVGLAAFAVSVVLTMIGAADEQAALSKLPWNTLIMITGVGVLISLVTELGGIDLLSNMLSVFMGPKTASAVMALLGGVMSWVSSASGVVMPTLIPTVPNLVETLPGTNALEIVVGLCIGAHAAAVSPLSSCGAMMLAAYSTSSNVDAKGRNKMFAQLFYLSAAGVAFSALLALLGLYR